MHQPFARCSQRAYRPVNSLLLGAMRSLSCLLFVPLIVLVTWAGTGPLAAQQPANTSASRGYLTTPQELRAIAEKAAAGLEPYRSCGGSRCCSGPTATGTIKLDEHETVQEFEQPGVD
ncbi:MAG: hypothetical protein KatS3mg051_1614 [Anaerolineae bacterium]|nr:MAG: hypothetical protein KatS3mg051_1614 [Anaerolineae bacterium]